MADTAARTIDSVEELLAHGKALEEDAAAHYEEIADAMEVHNNLEVSALFRTLTGYALDHAREMIERAGDKTLPHIRPWDFKWPNGSSPEAAALAETHYLMTPYHALKLAHRAETHACDFYSRVAEETSDEEVRALAREFADEEAEHVALIEKQLADIPKPEDGWDYDPDPANIPE